MYTLSKYVVITDLDADYKLIYSTRTARFPRIRAETLDRIAHNELDHIGEKTLATLFDSEILVPRSEDEFETVIQSFETAAQSRSDTLSYTIQPSANCQLGCAYCGQVHEKLNLSAHQSEKIYRYIESELSAHPYKGIAITWYGAEPLLGMNGIRDLSHKLLALTQKNELRYRASIITNGLAMKEHIFKELVDLQVTRYQITLDGTQEKHDNSRFTKKGGKTYKPILKNIVTAVHHPLYKEKKCGILIRCNVHRQNYASIDKLIQALYDLGIHDQISMDFAPIHDWGNNQADNDIGLSPEFFGALEIEWMLKLKALGFKESGILLPKRVRETCMLTNDQSELIDAKGRISYCWETPYTPDFDYEGSPFFIGHVNTQDKKDRKTLPLGNWYEDIRAENHNTWCKGCTFLPVCGGSCPTSWYKGKPACPSFKYNFEDRMVMQYLEDVEYDFSQTHAP